jgi:hypothetical protein
MAVCSSSGQVSKTVNVMAVAIIAGGIHNQA